MKMTKKRFMALLLSVALTVSVIPSAVMAQELPETSEVVTADPEDGSIEAVPGYEGPQIEKIRVLSDANYLEIYWDRYVDEAEAIDIANYTLKNGNTTIRLKAKGTANYTDTLYFDRKNKEVGATDANSMSRLDPDLHMSSIGFEGAIDKSKGITLEVKGTTIKDESGKSARSVTYSNIPYISFYTQFLTTKTGIIIKADDTVARSSMEKAAEQVDVQLGKLENGIAENMKKYNCSLAVYSPQQNAYMIPEHRYGFSLSMYDVEGYGGAEFNNCVSSIAERNVLRVRNNWDNPEWNTGYPDENILIHEFGHCVKSVGMDLLEDKSLANEFYAAYENAKAKGLWPNTYCIQNADEFFATMCTIWFNVMSEARDFTDGVRGPVNTRAELKRYDPQTYNVFAKILPEATLPKPWDQPGPDEYHPEYEDPGEADKTVLQEAIAKAKAVDADQYTEATVKAMNEALKAAEILMEDDSLTGEDQTEVDAAAKRLTEAVENLETKRVEDIFRDVNSESWYRDSVQYVFERDIMTGMNDSEFGSDAKLARSHFATMLYRLEGSPEIEYTEKFQDVPDEQFYTDAVMWASSEGVNVISGYADGNFGPNDNITREQMAVMLYRYAQYKKYNTAVTDDLRGFEDSAKVSPFAKDGVKWAVGTGLLKGEGESKTLNPQGDTSRAVCAAIMQRFMENQK